MSELYRGKSCITKSQFAYILWYNLYNDDHIHLFLFHSFRSYWVSLKDFSFFVWLVLQRYALSASQDVVPYIISRFFLPLFYLFRLNNIVSVWQPLYQDYSLPIYNLLQACKIYSLNNIHQAWKNLCYSLNRVSMRGIYCMFSYRHYTAIGRIAP